MFGRLPRRSLAKAGSAFDVFKISMLPQNIPAFRRALLHWYRRHGRDLPWRHTRDPYAILVSEVMLQQTPVTTVLPRYRQWLRRFSGFKTLARATQNDVLHAWQGLGYYARARNLHTSAKVIAKDHAARFPTSIDAMRHLPGIGKYTAHAVACFAFEQPVPIVEANTARVLSRLFNLQIPVDLGAGREALWDRAASLIPKRSAPDYNSALIDLGALVCLPRPKCAVCPVKPFCSATHPEKLPIKKTGVRKRRFAENHALIVRHNEILLQQADRRWRGMWILPTLQRRPAGSRPIHSSVFPFTHHRITLRVFRRARENSGNRSQRWFPLKALQSIPIPSPHRRAITTLLH
jgi:A/G-specific adenine glycosylase